MPGIVEFPQVVRDALAQYGDLFANECQRRHFAEYLTGLMVAERKTVLGINREFDRSRLGISFGIGAAEMRLVDMASAYQVVANSGRRLEPTFPMTLVASTGTGATDLQKS